MHGSMCAHAGVLYVGRHAKSAQITAYDLDGRLLRRIAEYRDEHAGRSSAAGLSLDADHRLWVADQAAGVLRGFTLFGVQVAEIRQEQGGADVAGELGEPVAVLALGSDDELVLTVASAGRRRHAVQVLEPAGGRSLSLRPDGDPEGRFEDVLGLASRGSRDLLVLEGAPRRVQVFRGGNFHFQVALDEIPGHGPATALAVDGDGTLIVAMGGDSTGIYRVADNGRRLGQVAWGGSGDGQVEEPCALAFVPGSGLQPDRLFVMDRYGDRIQVFTLEGTCYGAFPALVS